MYTDMAIAMLTKGCADTHTDKKLWIYQGKKIKVSVEWGIWILTKQLHYNCQENLNPSDVVEVQAVVGEDYSDTAFQFGAVVTAKLRSGDESS